MVSQLSQRSGPGGINYLSMLPDFHNHWDIAMAVFIMPIAVQWWSVWYPGAEPGGGSYIAQRMLASRSEKDALGGTLFFNVAHYVLRPWPWILVALCSLIIYPNLSDIQKSFPALDPKLLGNDIAYPAMLRFLPVGWMGLMLAGLIAANSSTILTHLNWGASYLVHDFYRRFIRTDADEKHYVEVGRLATVLLFVGAAGITFVLDSAKDTFDIMLQVGAGTGLLYLVRWFWWRVNAWSEVAAMASSFVISVGWLVRHKLLGHPGEPHVELVITIALTTVCWMLVTFIAKPTDRRTLIAFYEKVRPAGLGWKRVRQEAGLPQSAAASGDNIPLALLGWTSGCAAIWSSLFTVGNFLYGRIGYGIALLVVFLFSGSILIWVVNQLWSSGPTREPVVTDAERVTA